jgi:putative transposase
MYQYRHLSDAQKAEVRHQRILRGTPLHAPPHYPDGKKNYILTAACYEHQPILQRENRRREFQARLVDGLSRESWAIIHAWVILPNHYHLLASVDLETFREWIRILHSKVATEWNREDKTSGRKVWYRFQDRSIRNEHHYFASLNYIHANPVKHGYAAKADEWKSSSIHSYLDQFGRETLVQLWKNYPVDDYGKGWDW